MFKFKQSLIAMLGVALFVALTTGTHASGVLESKANLNLGNRTWLRV